MSINIQGRYLTVTIPVIDKEGGLKGYKRSTVAFLPGLKRDPKELIAMAVASAQGNTLEPV